MRPAPALAAVIARQSPRCSLGRAAALALARYRFTGRNMLVAFFMSPLVLPNVVLGAAIMQCAARFGAVRSLGASRCEPCGHRHAVDLRALYSRC